LTAAGADFYVPRMRLFSAKVSPIATEIVRTLRSAGDIEAESPREVEQDVASVLTSYVDAEHDVNERAKDLLQQKNLPGSELPRIKKLVAEQKGIKLGEDTLDYLLDQVVEMLLHSNNVDEVFAADNELRRKMAPIFKKHMNVDEELEREVRGQLRHMKEGTATWEVEYQRVMSDIRRRKGL
jgi:uncharacterized protein